MPTYDYRCEDCRKTMEIFHRMSETKRKCPRCGSSRFRRLLGAGAGFLFRGSGFYTTDYRSSDYLSKAKAESEGAGKAPGTSTEKGEKSTADKPAGKSEKPSKKSRREVRRQVASGLRSATGGRSGGGRRRGAAPSIMGRERMKTEEFCCPICRKPSEPG